MTEQTRAKPLHQRGTKVADREALEMALQLAVRAHADDLAALAHRADHKLDGDVLDKAERYAKFLSSDD